MKTTRPTRTRTRVRTVPTRTPIPWTATVEGRTYALSYMARWCMTQGWTRDQAQVYEAYRRAPLKRRYSCLLPTVYHARAAGRPKAGPA